MDPYKELANGIVLRAVLDYKAALRRARKGQDVKATIIELEAFFRSGWFVMLSDLDGDRVIRQLRSQMPRKKKTQSDRTGGVKK